MRKNRKTDNKTVEKVAEILTRILSPITALFLGIIIVFFEYVSTEPHYAFDWLAVAIVVLILAVATLLLFMKTGLVSNWDITDRKQRPKFLGLVSVYILILVFITAKMGYISALPILTLLATGVIIATIITLFWKVSFHTFAVTMIVLLVIAKYGESYMMYLLLALPFLAAWSRVVLGKHTLYQAIGGIFLGIAVLWLWLILPVQWIFTLV